MSHFDQRVAIVGLGCRFPGASTPRAFWSNLVNGIHSIRMLEDAELDSAGVPASIYQKPGYVKACYPVQYHAFDADYFGYTPAEAEKIDPQQRLYLECAVEALNSASIDPDRSPGRIGVFAGVGLNVSLLKRLSDSGLQLNPEEIPAWQFANDKDYLTTRISYKLNMKGPSIVVQTACSSSLVATHLACQSVIIGECDVALAGGVALGVVPTGGYQPIDGGILSSDGYCRAFDAEASGTVWGAGAGVVALMRLEDAIAQRHDIIAVIAGSATNNDGAQKAGYTAPGMYGQADVVAAAQAMAEVDADQISYIEAHGTGTKIGDPIEIHALNSAFRTSIRRNQFCAIGSVKTNIGHLGAAAGIAGLIKTALSIKHRTIVPSLHYRQPNPEIPFQDTPFYVASETESWRASEAGPRRAGVSSFGIGGTNAHVVLEEAPSGSRRRDASRPQLLAVSAKTEDALERMKTQLCAHLRDAAPDENADVAFSLAVGRGKFRHRCTLVVSPDGAANPSVDQFKSSPGMRQGSNATAFVFPGQGAQYINMGRALYLSEPVFRAAFQACCEVLRPLSEIEYESLLYPEKTAVAVPEMLNQTSVTQPALFSFCYALARLWMSWGIAPAAMIGHSIGEFVAATLSGVLELPDALRLVVCRGRQMQKCVGGSMLWVSLPRAELEPILTPEVTIAAVNGPSQIVVAGPEPAVHRIEQNLRETQVLCSHLRTSHAFHSEQMAPAAEAFRAEVARISLGSPKIPYVSNVTGTWISEAQVRDPDYWAAQILSPVLFADGIGRISEETSSRFLIVGPDGGLGRCVAAQLHASGKSGTEVIASLPGASHPQAADCEALLLEGLGRLWLSGAEVDWDAVYVHREGLRVALPTYPFAKTRFGTGADLHSSPEHANGEAVLRSSGARIAFTRTEHTASPASHERFLDEDVFAQAIRAIWSDSLGKAIESPDLHFFELGGDSLLAGQVVAMVNRVFALEFPYQGLFEAKSLEDFTEAVRSVGNASELERTASVFLSVRSMSSLEIDEALASVQGRSVAVAEPASEPWSDQPSA